MVFDVRDPFDPVLLASLGLEHVGTRLRACAQANLVGFLNVLEGCRQHRLGHLVCASSSSVYGGRRSLPFRDSDRVAHPVSLYAATRKANELMAHSDSHRHGLASSGRRFFKVYGPWARPDMACCRFARAILAREPIGSSATAA